jgi:hypothetical protein
VIERRNILSAIVALGAAKALPSPSASAREAPQALDGRARKPPVQPVALRSAALAVILDGSDGLPYRFDFGSGSLSGEDAGQPIQAILCQLDPRRYTTVTLRDPQVILRSGSALFRFQLAWNGAPAVDAVLRYDIDGASLLLTLENVREHAGFELIELAIPNLVTVREDEPDAWMAQGRNGGSFVRLKHATSYRYEDDENFGRISTQLPIGVVGTRRVGCMLEVSAFMDGTETSIVDLEGERRAYLGTVQVHRVHGGRCYNMNDGGDPVCGDANTPNLMVEQKSRCRFDFYSVEDPEVPWFAAAKLLRARMPLSPTAYFNDKLLYLIGGKAKTEPVPRTTFAQSRELIRDIALLTDYAPQTAFISGWVYQGQDTGYPSEDVVNASLGTYEELMNLMADGPSLQTNVSVNVNYDDAYKSSPLFDLDFIAREPNGAVWKSRAWDGEDSYIVGMAKFAAGGWARRRIDHTMSRYRLRDAILIDALSWYAIRNDWDPKHPASGYKNLVDGKWVVLDEFRSRGVEVVSENFRYPMLGKLALSVNGPEPRSCPFGGEQIPLTAIIYRRCTIFGGPGDGLLRPQQSLFWNSRPGLWFDHKTDRREITDFYYLVALPFAKVHALEVVSYAATESLQELRLQGEASISMVPESSRYEVVWKGATIARNGSTTCPLDDDRIAFYSLTGGRLSYPLPAAWSASNVTARRLTLSGPAEFPLRVLSGEIVVDAPPREPVIVYATLAAIPATKPR